MSKARNLSDFISDATIDSTEIADLSVTHAKLHTDMNLSSKTLTFAANQISGNSVDGGVISNFASTGIDDNASATAVTILSDGKVGIGTASPSRKLTVLGVNNTTNFEVTDAAGGNTFNIYNNTTSSAVAIGTSSGLMSFGFNGIDKVHFKSDGKVGIGTNSPDVKFHVSGGNARIAGTETSGSFMDINPSNTGSDGVSLGASYYGSGSYGPIKFSTGGTERMRITSGGDVSIGSDHSGFSGWRVLNMRQVSTGALINFEEDDGTRASTLAAWGSALRYQTHIAGGYHKFETDASTNAFQINDNGHVVVNTHEFPNNPTGSKLNVFGDGEVLRLDGTGNTSRTFRFRGCGTNGSANAIIESDGILQIKNEDANAHIYLNSVRDIAMQTTSGNGTAGHFTFSSYNTEIMRIDGANNRVGIGTTGPSALLEVRNSTTATDSIIASAGLVTAGHYHDLIVGDGPNYAVGLRRYITQSNPSWLRPRLDFIVQNANTYLPADRQVRMSISDTGSVSVYGSLSKGSGSFKIDHPLPSKTETHNLVHSFVESPQANNIYRGKVVLVDGSATINIDTVSGMTDGTYVLLNTNTQCFTSNETGWTAVKGSVSGNTLTITSQVSCTDTISWMVIGERHDQHMIDTDWTNEYGKVIVEPLKENEPE